MDSRPGKLGALPSEPTELGLLQRQSLLLQGAVQPHRPASDLRRRPAACSRSTDRTSTGVGPSRPSRESEPTSRTTGPFMNRLTISLGLRFDRVVGVHPGLDAPGRDERRGARHRRLLFQGRCTDSTPGRRTRRRPGTTPCSGIPCPPRVGLSYDLFGNGKTALKVSFAQIPRSHAGHVLSRATIPSASPSGARTLCGSAGGTTTTTAFRMPPSIDQLPALLGEHQRLQSGSGRLYREDRPQQRRPAVRRIRRRDRTRALPVVPGRRQVFSTV